MSMKYSNILRKKKYPFVDLDEDISSKPIYHFSFFKKIGLISSLIISVIILIFSIFSLYMDIFIKKNYNYILTDIIIGVMSFYAVYFIINEYKLKAVYEMIIDTAFQEGIYSRLQPLIENIAKSHVDTNILIEKVNNIDLKIQSLSKESYEKEISPHDLWKEPIAIGTSIKFVIKSIFLLTFTMAIFMFLINFNIGWITQYAVLFIFFIWWSFITYEYRLWKELSAWAFIFLPILILPVLIMILNKSVNYNILIAILYFSVGTHTIIYFLWANYISTGSLPIVTIKKQPPSTKDFFSMQEKGLFRELLDTAIVHIEEKMQKENETKETDYVWKKN